MRIVPGVYLRPDDWETLDGRDRHRTLVRAVAPRIPRGARISHLSAAALRGWAHIGAWPERVQVTVADPGRRRVAGVSVRSSPARTIETTAPDTFVGIAVADAVTTAVGSVVDADFPQAVVLVDSALRDGLRADSLRAVSEAFEGRGHAHLERVIGTSDGRHESVGESFCAARLAEFGLRGVRAQHPFEVEGAVYRVDFWLPDERVVIEFDGRQKYTDPAMLGGRSADDVLWAEKQREDRIRPHVRAFVRVR